MAFHKIVDFVVEVLIFAIKHDFQCTNAVIKIKHFFFIFYDVVYHVSIQLCSCFFFQLLIKNERMKLCMRKTNVSSVFSSFHMSFSLSSPISDLYSCQCVVNIFYGFYYHHTFIIYKDCLWWQIATLSIMKQIHILMWIELIYLCFVFFTKSELRSDLYRLLMTMTSLKIHVINR